MLEYTLAEVDAFLGAIERAGKRKNADLLLLLRTAAIDDGKPYAKLLKALTSDG